MHKSFNYNVDTEIAFVSTENVKLPPSIIDLIKDTYTSTSSMIDYNTCIDIIFHGDDSGCVGYIIDPNQYHLIQVGKEIDCYIWKYPSTPSQYSQCNNLAYSTKYGLIGLFSECPWYSGDDQLMYVLSFDSQQYNKQNKSKWKWEKKITMKSHYKRFNSCFTMLNKDKLLICGGNTTKRYGNNNAVSNVDIYDMDKEEWTKMNNMNHNRRKFGFCVNNDKIYVAGGEQVSYLTVGQQALYVGDNVEFCDINKDKWIELPNTEYQYGDRPIISNKYDVNILYIASIKSNSIEMLDLRENKWREISKKLNEYFNIPKCNESGYYSYPRLLHFS